MNALESFAYQLVKQNPKIKNLVRDIYQALFSLYPVASQHAAFPVKTREGYFFGFHDKQPWSGDKAFLLAHSFNNLRNRMPLKGDSIDIGTFSGEDYMQFQKISSTSCFNWQQGSMLQWLGKSGNLVFNDVKGLENVARVFSTAGRELGVLSLPVASVNPAGTLALSYNFARLQRHFPGYGYTEGTDPEIEKEIPSTHGISILDIAMNSATRLFSVSDIAAIEPEKSMKGSFHFLTHCLFSPSGQRFVFLHRWIKNDNFSYTRMFSADVNGGNLHIFPAPDMVSHIAWQDDSHILAYARSKENKDAYILFTDKSDEYRLIGDDVLNSDGHPSFPEGFPQWFVTDTYPDRFRRSFLILYNIIERQRTDLGYFRQPVSFKEEIRCDLHPRWNHDGTMICFDSAHTGKRALCTMDIGDLLSADKNKLTDVK
jgi:hypothetical protein